MIKTFEKFNDNDPYGEEDWNPVHEQEVTSMFNIYLCTRDCENFTSGYIYIIMGIMGDANVINTNVKVRGSNINEFLQMNFNPNEDPFMQSLADGSLIYIGKLDR